MEILNKKSDDELLRSLLGEIAKARNEMSCASGDIQKAQSRYLKNPEEKGSGRQDLAK